MSYTEKIAAIRATKLIKVTLGGIDEFSEAFDVRGFSELWPMLAALDTDTYQVNFQVSADGETWAAYDGYSSFTLYTSDPFQPYRLESIGIAIIKAPYIRFASAEITGNGKSFYLYCIA